MKKTSLFFLLFFLNFSLFAQKDSLQIFEKQGDSLFLAGQNDQASRVYFRAFLKDILNRRLQDKFGLRNMEQYFSRGEYRMVFVRDSTQEKHQQIAQKLNREADSLFKLLEIEQVLSRYHELLAFEDSVVVRAKINRTEAIQKDLLQYPKDSLIRLTVKIEDGITEEIVDAPLQIKSVEGKKYSPTKIEAGVYQIALPLGRYEWVANHTGDFQETREEIPIYPFNRYDSVIVLKMSPVCTLMVFYDINFTKNQSRVVLNERNGRALEQIKMYLFEYKQVIMKIEAHCSDREKNAKYLSFCRAIEVVKELVNRGIAPHRFILEYFGADSPIVPNDSESNRALNRRVEFKPTLPKKRK